MQKKSPLGEVYKHDTAVMIFDSEISVFIFKQKGKLPRPIAFLLNTDDLYPPPLEAVMIFIGLQIISKRLNYNKGLLSQTQIL